MHETHLIQPLIDGISRHAAAENGRKVTRVRLKIGQFMGVAEAPFRETFAVLARGTRLEGAALEISFFPASRIEVLSFDIE